jgi:hypothetical protein
MSDSEYLDRVLETTGCVKGLLEAICQHPGMVQDELDKASGYGAENELKPTKKHRSSPAAEVCQTAI